jgi:hypothetical protein
MAASKVGQGKVVMYGKAAWQAMSELAPGSPWKAMTLLAFDPARARAIVDAPQSALIRAKSCGKARKTLQNPGLATFRRASAAAPMEYY